jgi:hypothetical protein
VTWRPTTARATLPHTSVDATTTIARECAGPPQPVSTVEPVNTRMAGSQHIAGVAALSLRLSAIRTSDFLPPAQRPVSNTNDNRFHYKPRSRSRIGGSA